MHHTALTTAGTPTLINTSAFTLTFPSIEVALAELGQKVFGATIVIAAPEPTPAPPTGLPPIPEGYVYIGEDTGGIVTGDISCCEQRNMILWFKDAFRSRGWHFTGYVSGNSHGWHAAAPIGHPLAELNAAAWQRDKAAPAVEEVLPPMPLAPDIEAHRRLTATLAQDHAIIKAQLERDEAVADAHAQREEVKRLVDECRGLRHEVGRLLIDRRSLTETLESCQSGNRSLNGTNNALKTERDVLKAQLAKAHKALGYIYGIVSEKDYAGEDINVGSTSMKSLLRWSSLSDLKPTPHGLGDLPTTPPAPAPTYRLLDVGETLREDDEVFVNAPPKPWIRYGKTGDNKIRKGPEGPYPFSYYRRKLTSEEAATGYRLLAEGEAIGEKDECRHPRSPNPENRDWRGLYESEMWWVGKCNETPSTQFRRKILPA